MTLCLIQSSRTCPYESGRMGHSVKKKCIYIEEGHFRFIINVHRLERIESAKFNDYNSSLKIETFHNRMPFSILPPLFLSGFENAENMSNGIYETYFQDANDPLEILSTNIVRTRPTRTL